MYSNLESDFIQAVIYNNKECMKNIFEKIRSKNIIELNNVGTFDINKAFLNYCIYGLEIDTLKWIYYNNKINIEYNKNTMFYESCFNANTDFVKWIYEIHPNKESLLSNISEKIFYKICNYNSNDYKDIVDILNFLVEEFPKIIDLANSKLLISLFRCNKLNVIVWLLNVKPGIFTDLNLEKVFYITCTNGFLELSQLLYERFLINSIELNKSILKKIIIDSFGNNIEMSKWLYYTFKNINIEYLNNDNSCDILMIACKNNKLDIAIWILNNIPNINLFHNYNSFIIACKKGYLEILEWMIQIEPNIIKDNQPLLSACENGKLSVVKWLMAKNPDIDISFDNYKVFNLSCFDDSSLNVSTWIYENYPGLDMSASNYECFLNACEYSQEKTIKWLVSLEKEIPIEILNKGFSKIMGNYDTNFIEDFLLEKFPNIDLSYNQEEPLINAVKINDLSRILWLLNKKPDINLSTRNDVVFKMSLDSNYYEILDLLCKKMPLRYKKIFDKSYSIILN